MTPPFEYSSPRSLAEGLGALDGLQRQRVRPLAGGTDLLPLVKSGIESPELLVDVKRIQELPRDIRIDANGARLGALATLSQIGGNAGLVRSFPALTQAALAAATPQLRNMATLGGTLLQRPRCWYFRNAHFRCWLKGGETCDARQGQSANHAIFDTGTCRAVHPSDIACALVALDAEVDLRGPKGARTLAVAEFIVPPSEARRTETLLASDELIVSVRVPAAAEGTRSVFLKAMDRATWSFATVSVAAAIRMQGERVADVHLVLGGVASVPWQVGDAMRPLIGSTPGEDSFAACARAALDDAQPLRMNPYKVPLAQALIRRALRSLCAG